MGRERKEERVAGESSHLPSVASGASLLGNWNFQVAWELLGELRFGAKSVVLTHPSRCVVVLFNPRKHKQHHILNSSR